MNLIKIVIAVLFFSIFLNSYSQTSYTFSDGLSKAKSTGKIAVVAIYQPSNNWCSKMEAVYSSSGISALLNNSFIFIKLNASGSETHSYGGKQYSASDLAKTLGAIGYPSHTFLSSDGSILKFAYNSEQQSSFAGYVDAGDFEKLLNYFLSGKYKDTDLSKVFK